MDCPDKAYRVQTGAHSKWNGKVVRQSDGSWSFTREDGYNDRATVKCEKDDTGKYLTIDTLPDASGQGHHANYRKATFSNGAYRGSCDDNDSGTGVASAAILSADSWTATPQSSVGDGWTASPQG